MTSNTNDTLLSTVKEWVHLDNEIKLLQKEIKNRKFQDIHHDPLTWKRNRIQDLFLEWRFFFSETKKVEGNHSQESDNEIPREPTDRLHEFSVLLGHDLGKLDDSVDVLVDHELRGGLADGGEGVEYGWRRRGWGRRCRQRWRRGRMRIHANTRNGRAGSAVRVGICVYDPPC